jgi:hypothetical protein
LFRDSLGEIIKSYNVDGSIDSIKMLLQPTDFINKKNHNTTLWDDYYQQGKLTGYYNVFQDNKQGVIDSLGNIVVPIKYNYVQHKPNSFLVHSDSGIAVINLLKQDKKNEFFDRHFERKPLIYLIKNDKFLQVFNYDNSTYTNLSDYEDFRWIGQGYEGLA